MGRLVSGVAHDLNNPLSYVQTNLQALREEHPALASSETLTDALHGVRQFMEIVSELRGKARAGSSRAIEFSVEAALVEAWRLVTPKLTGLRATWTAEPGLPPVVGSQRLLVQALVNLNRQRGRGRRGHGRAGPPLGRGQGARRRRDRRRSPSTTVVPGSRPIAEHLFDFFNSTKGTSGTGLGLALVRGQTPPSAGGRSRAGTGRMVAPGSSSASRRGAPSVLDGHRREAGSRGRPDGPCLKGPI